jgi:hypothetical protein
VHNLKPRLRGRLYSERGDGEPFEGVRACALLLVNSPYACLWLSPVVSKEDGLEYSLLRGDEYRCFPIVQRLGTITVQSSFTSVRTGDISTELTPTTM